MLSEELENFFPLSRACDRFPVIRASSHHQPQRLRSDAPLRLQRFGERFEFTPVGKPVLQRNEVPPIVECDLDIIIRVRGPLAEIELHVRPHGAPRAPMPRVVVVTIHRFGCAGAVRLEQRIRLRFVERERLRARVGGLGRPAFDGLLQPRPSCEAVLARERMLDVTECRRGRSVRKGACQPRTGLGIARSERGEPALCFFLEAFEIATRLGVLGS